MRMQCKVIVETFGQVDMSQMQLLFMFVAKPFVISSFLLLVVLPGAPSSVLAPILFLLASHQMNHTVHCTSSYLVSHIHYTS